MSLSLKEEYQVKHSDNSAPLLKCTEVSRILNVHINTVRRWSNQGTLTPYRIGPRGDRRFRPEQIREALTLRAKDYRTLKYGSNGA